MKFDIRGEHIEKKSNRPYKARGGFFFGGGWRKGQEGGKAGQKKKKREREKVKLEGGSTNIRLYT